jgi:hypothetical protein
MKAEFPNKMLSDLEINALSNDEKINYIDWLQKRLMGYQLVISTFEDKNEKFHR